MKDRLSGLFKSRTFYIVLSILLAVGAWLLVVSSRNPSESRTLEVPITFVNRQVLSQNDLVDNSPTTQPTKVTVKVSGSATFIEKLQPSDIYVEVDYQQVTEPGAVTVKIKEPVCDTLGVKVESYYPTEIECVYDKRIEKYIDVAVDWDESLMADGVTIVNAVSEPASILITGFSMDLDQIDSVRANIGDAVKQGSITQSGSASLVCRFYNANGDDISYNFDTEKVTVKYTVGKIVPVTYTITGAPDSDYYVASHTPSVASVVLTGDASAIGSLSAIDLGDISVQGATGNFTKTVNVNQLLPDGVSVSGTDSVTVTVNIEPYATKELSVSADNVRKVGEDSSYTYSYSLNSSSITVKGTSAVLDRLEVSALSYSLDVGGKGPGTHELEIKFSLPDGVLLQSRVTCTVTITRTNTNTATAAPSDTPAATATPEEATPTPLEPEPTESPEPTEESDQP